MAAPIIAVSGPSGAGKTTVARLLAQSFDPSVHLQSDAFMASVVNGWVDPWLEESARQNQVMGAAVGSAAIQFAVGGYTVLLDGSVFPDGAESLAEFCSQRDVALHYVVLRPDLATCLERIQRRPDSAADPAGRPEYVNFSDRDAFARLHARFMDLGNYEETVFSATGPPEQVAEAVLEAVMAGTVKVT